MAFTNEDVQEIKEIVLETIAEESDPIEDVQQVSELSEGDEVPIVRSGQGVNSYGRAPVNLFGGGGGGVVIVNDLTTGGTTKALSAEMGKTLKGMVDAISAGAVLTVSFSYPTAYKGESVTVTASLSKVTPQTITLDGTSAQNQSSISKTVTATDPSKTYTATATYNGILMEGSGTLYARNKIYYGFGSTASAVGVDANKYARTTTAAHTYSGTASANGQYFFILVPSDITDVSTFTMGGAPFAMDAVTTTTIGGVTYKVHKSSNSYNSGTELNVKAE